jgi:hypothetical protein
MAGHDDFPVGSSFEDRYLMQRAMCGDMVFSITPATVAGVAGTGKAASSRTVTIELKTADGEVHHWFNKAIANGVSIADTTTPAATIPSTTLTFVKGVATVVITLPEGDYVADQTNTLTVAQATVLGYTIAQKTSVQTFA